MSGGHNHGPQYSKIWKIVQFKKIALFYDIYSRKTQFIKPRFGRKKPSSLLDNFIIHYDLIYYMNQFNECD